MTTFTAPTGTAALVPIPHLTLPGNAPTVPLKGFAMAPVYPLPQTFQGTNDTTSVAI